jgi:hypothetical protein
VSGARREGSEGRDPNASREEKQVAAYFQAQLFSRFDHYRQVYLTRFKRIINVDNAKELCVFYSKNAETRARYSACLYDAAKRFTRRLFECEVGNSNIKKVIFLSGGAGSGKSVLNFYMEGQKNALVVDGTLSALGDANDQIRLAIACEKQIEIIHVFCPLELAVEASLRRALRSGRTISLESLARTHYRAQTTFLSLLLRFYAKGEPIAFAVMDNSVYSNPHFKDLSFLRNHQYSSLDSVLSTSRHAFQSVCVLLEKETRRPIPDYIKAAFARPGRKVA